MAVYTTLSQSDLEHVTSLYGFHSINEAIPIAEGVENSNYCIHYADHAGAQHRAILTIFEDRVEARDLPFFLELKQHLRRKNIHCPEPYRTLDGKIFCQIGRKQAAIVSFLNGKSIMEPNAQQTQQAGETLARMHIAAKDFPLTRPNAMSFTGWHELRARINAKKADLKDISVLEIIDGELNYLHKQWDFSLPSGIIHADFFPNNVFFGADGYLSGVIDFYFACHDLLSYDIAIVANAWCFDASGTWQKPSYDALLKGYESVRKLDPKERGNLPTLLRAAALRFYLTRLHDVLYHDPDALLTPHNPEDYLRILQFHQTAL